MHPLAAHLHSTHQRHIQEALTQGAAGDFERSNTGELLCFHRVARPLQVEQQANAVGDDVGHGAHRHAGFWHGGKDILQGIEPSLADVQAPFPPGDGPFLGMGPGQIAGGLGIATHANEHAAAGGVDFPQPGGHMAGGLKHQQLLGQRLGQILGRVAQPLEGQPDFLDAFGCGLAGDQRLQQGTVGFGAAGSHFHGHHRERYRWQRLGWGGCGAAFPVGLVPLFHDHVRIVAAKAKGVDAGAARPFGLPGLGLLQQMKAQLGQFLDGFGHLAIGRHDLVLEGAKHLHHGGKAGDCDGVAHVALDGAHRRARGKQFMAALELDAVTHHRAGGVAFQKLHGLGVKPGLLIGTAQCAQLAIHVRYQQAACAAIVGEAHAAHQTIDAIPCGQRILQALEHHRCCSFAGNQAIGVGIEGPALGAGRKGLQHAKAHRDDHGVGVVDAGGQRHIGAALLQRLAGLADGVERGGAGGIQREGLTQTQRLGGQVGGITTTEAVGGCHFG